MQQTGQHQTFYEEIKCFINFLKAISSILEKLLLYSREKIEIFSCQNSNKLPTIMFIRQGDNLKTIRFVFQVGIIKSCLHQRQWNFSISKTFEFCRNSHCSKTFEKDLLFIFVNWIYFSLLSWVRGVKKKLILPRAIEIQSIWQYNLQ